MGHVHPSQRRLLDADAWGRRHHASNDAKVVAATKVAIDTHTDKRVARTLEGK